jgi:hypothetical protein
MNNNTQTLKCPNCSAPLTVHPGETVVMCAYCGSRVQVAQPVQPAPTPVPAPANEVTSVAYPSYTPVAIQRQAVTAFRVIRWVGCLGTGLVIVLCALLIVGMSNLMFRTSPSFDLAMQMAQSNLKVAAVFGMPIQPGLFITGSISTNGSRSEVNYDIPISGPRRSGTLHVQGNSTEDGWTLDVWAHYQDRGEDVNIHMSTPR